MNAEMPERMALHLSGELELTEFPDALFFLNCRELLCAVTEAGGTKATEAGNLTRKFVLEMLDRGHWPEDYVDTLWSASKVLNEQDVWELHIPRVVCELSGLLRRAKGRYRVTKKGQELLADDRAGQLYGLMFGTFFRKLNLAYLDPWPELSLVYDLAPCWLVVMADMDTRWRGLDEFTRLFLPFRPRDELAASVYGQGPVLIVWSRFLSPLVGFGLLQTRERSGDSKWPHRIQYRKTPLFDRFITVLDG